MNVLIAGCGWLGAALGRRLLARGDRAVGIRRDPARAGALRALGIEPLCLDLTAPGAAERVPRCDAIVACQAAGGDSVEAYRAAYVDASRALLRAAERDGTRLVYTGSTGVFGQRDGAEVDEDSPPAPASPAAQVLVEAETLIREAAGRGLPASVLRLSGLYGPGRVGILERVRTGRLALGPGDEAWMNFCHLEDAVTFVLAALARAAPGAVNHGSDAAPARRREVVGWIAARLGIEPPRGVGGAAGPDRRIRSEASRRALGVELAFPSFREGLAPLLPGGGGS